jgi:hypothetical protein
VVYLANCAQVTRDVRERVERAALLLMDGTLWRDDEMVAQGAGSKTGRRMGHVSMSGPEGAVARLADVEVGRRVFLHVNNTNPALLADSPERAELARAGWEVAFDGMDIAYDRPPLALDDLRSADELEAMLRRIGAERYHIHHPFHRLLHGGRLSRGQVQAWALNRYYYQSRIPMKDAALLSRCEDRELRREWLVRVLDHDGMGEQEGGIMRWLRLCEGLGLDPLTSAPRPASSPPPSSRSRPTSASSASAPSLRRSPAR